MNREELAWAAGLFEGEGCISMQKQARSHGIMQPTVVLAMTDRDTVERFRDAVGFGNITVRPSRQAGKPLYVWRADSFERMQAMVALLWRGLGQRRRARASEVLRAVKASQVHRRTMRRASECQAEPECHAPVIAKNMCSKHYQRSRIAARHA